MNEVRAENLQKRFDGVSVVDGVSFRVGSGEVLGFLGPNGAGKSTTMRMITGFLAPDGGRVTVAGYDPMEDPVAARSRIGYLPEGAPLYADMTPFGLLGFICECRGFERAERRRRIHETAERVNLGTVMHQRIETLSKGYKRRVGLAQALLHDPDVLILDEPTDGLDPTQKIEVRSLIRQMARNKVIILSTHILEEVEAVCTRAVIIANGALVADDTPQGLIARAPGHNRVVVRIAADDGNGDAEVVRQEVVRQILGAIPGVAGLQARDGADRAVEYRLSPERNAAADGERVGQQTSERIAARIAELAVEHRWKVLELRRPHGSLEEVFTTLTRAPD